MTETENLHLRRYALDKALEFVKKDFISIKDGDYDLFECAEKFYSFITNTYKDKYGIKENPRPKVCETRESLPSQPINDSELEEIKKAETLRMNEEFLKQVLKEIFK